MNSNTTFNDNTKTDDIKQRLKTKIREMKNIRIGRTTRATPLTHKQAGGWIQKLYEDNGLVAPTKRFLETIGSMDKNCKTMNFVDILTGPLSKHVHQFHDGKEFDSNDCARFQEINATNGTENIKGSSAKGYGLRMFMAQLNAYKIGENIDHLLEEHATRKNLNKMSFIVTKITAPIEITDKETGITNKYTSEDDWLILTVVTNQTDTWLKDNFAIGDVDYDTKLAIMKELVKYPDAKCHTFYHDLKGKNYNYKCLVDQIDSDFKHTHDTKTSAEQLLHAIRFVTSGREHERLIFKINNMNILLRHQKVNVLLTNKPQQEWNRRIIDKRNNLPYLKVNLIGFSKNKKNYLKVTIEDEGCLKTKIPEKVFYLYNIGRDDRTTHYKLKKGGFTGFNQILLENWKTDDIPLDYEILEKEKLGEWEMEIHSFYKNSEAFKELQAYYGKDAVWNDGVVIVKNNCMCNDKFYRGSNIEDKIDCCDFFRSDGSGTRNYHDGKHDYNDKQHMQVSLKEISANKTIININSDKARTKLLRYNSGADSTQMIQFTAPCLWREYLTDKQLRIGEPKPKKTELEEVKEENTKLKSFVKKATQQVKLVITEKAHIEKNLKKAVKVAAKAEDRVKEVTAAKVHVEKKLQKAVKVAAKAEDKMKEVEDELEKVTDKNDDLEQENEDLKEEVAEYKKMESDPVLRTKIYARDFKNKLKGTCPCCGHELNPFRKGKKKYTPSLGHIMPESLYVNPKTGESYVNFEENYLMICKSCNSENGTKDMRTYVLESYGEKKQASFLKKYKNQFDILDEKIQQLKDDGLIK